jgi:hypothetical protein
MANDNLIASDVGVEKIVGATRMHMLFTAWVVIMRYLAFR